MEINIKEIIKPKFEVGSTVFVRKGDRSVKKSRVMLWELKLRSDDDPQFTYMVGESSHSADWWPQSSLFATAEEAFSAK